MSESTYEQAKTWVMHAAPMSPKRWRALPQWLHAHLTNLTNHLDDALKDIAALQIELEKANEATERAQLKEIVRGVKRELEPVDWSKRNLPEAGRYEGDLFAQLTVLPGDRKPYTVRVWAWHYSYNQEKWLWRNAYADTYMDKFNHEKSFRKSWQAIDHLNKVRGHADVKPLLDRIDKAREAGRTLVS